MSVSDPSPERPYFRWYINNHHRTNNEKTIESAKRAEMHFCGFLGDREIHPEDVDEELAIEFIYHIVDEYSPHSQHRIINEVKRFYGFCLSNGVDGFEGNPFKTVLDKHNLLEDRRSRDAHIISVDEMSSYLSQIDHPKTFLGAVMMAKTSRRIGEVINLDLADLNIDHPACDWDVHPKIRHHEDYLYISPEPEKGEKYRGEVRHCSNKSETHTVIPIDDELKQALLWYLLIRRGSLNPDSPLFKQVKNDKREGKRNLAHKIIYHSKEIGYWYEPYDDDNINAHYFRHWATTVLRDRSTGDTGLVDYLRGDKGNSMKDRYTHWSDAKEKEYLKIVPKFFRNE